MSSATRAAIEAVWRIESARVIGGLMRLTKDLGRAEDLAQEALLAALERWPEAGIPDNPGAWLVATGKNRTLDELRRDGMRERKHAQLAPELAVHHPELESDIDDARTSGGDDVLRLMLGTCHPVLSTEARTALTLRLVAGLTTDEIARAYLLPEPTIAQRIVRAKRTLTEARVPFEVPRGAELAERIATVIEVVYLVFNEGYAASSGGEWMRTDLCGEALRLSRVLAALVESDAEVQGLNALLEIQSSRQRARLAPDGTPVLLLDQDRSKWDALLIGRGLLALERAASLREPLGPYTLQAAIAACHARARRPEDTDWRRIVALYDALAALTGSPVVELNRAVAVGMAFGPEEALELVDQLTADPRLEGYHLMASVRGDLLAKLGRNPEARAELERAAFMTQNERERAMLVAKARSLP